MATGDGNGDILGSEPTPGDRAKRSAEQGADDAGDPDLPLLRRIAAGDGAASAALVDRHLGRIVALAWRMLGSRAEAEDVAQDTFLRAWQQAALWRPEGARFATWLHRVAVNLCLDRLRRRREVDLDAAGDPPADEVHPGTALQRQAVADRVDAALALLPERQRTAIVLCHFQELGNIEAAAVMEIGVEALESLLGRGRRRLRELLRAESANLMGELE
jgi:RNA polymerase sigma-70 factor (ECF subfamily)